ncbi:MAG: S8 family serine peptidase, partial [Candidatus Cloacimonadota bacterium]
SVDVVTGLIKANFPTRISSYGVDLDVVAPGELVLSTYKTTPGEQYLEQSGTSMSSPYVTGAIALLKSIRPDLSPEEVRSRVLNSTDDLGDPGFDTRYGHGLLNTRKLLENTNPPVINLTYPLEMQGVSDAFQILGTVQAESFLRYSVMRSSKSTPAESDWRNVHDDTSQPYYYYSQVTDGLVAQFNIPDHLPEAKYLIRIQFRDQQGASYNYYRTVIYDSSSPTLIAGSLQSFERYDAQNLKHYVSAKFNEPVRSSLLITASDGSHHFSYAAAQDSIQIWALPASIPPGMIGIQIVASNQSGLTYDGQLVQNFKNIQYRAINTYGYDMTDIGPGRVPLTGSFDFNGNNYQEYVAMDLPTTGYGRVRAYEPRSAGHLLVHDFNDNFQPLALGSTDNESMELLGHKSDRVYLRKQNGTQIYPSTIAWQDSSVSGGTLGNFTSGNTGILLVKNLTNENVIQTYKRATDSTFVATNQLRNTTPTSLRNTFAPTIVVDNLDRDALPDILCADTDGDILVYEVINANSEQLCWTHRMPVANTYQLSSGDYTGDGNREFIVGGNYTSILNPDMNFWYFESFRTTGNNQYESMGSIMFNNVQSQNAIHSADLDEDGKDEVILALSPNLYIMRYTDGSWLPEFYGESFQTFRIGTYTDSQNKLHFLTNYKVSADSTRAAEWSRGTNFTGPQSPYLSLVEPNDEQSVQISWLDSGAPAYNVYIKYPDGSTELVASTDANSYLIQGLTESLTYGFTVTAVDDSYSPSESMPSPWRMATPYRRPTLMGINMVGNNEIRILFDQAMANDAVNPSYYSVDNGIGMPSSVNQIFNQHGMQLRFSTNFTLESSPYTLSFHNVKGKTGTIPEISEISFAFVLDTEAPRVLSAAASADRKSFTVQFSEALDPEGISNMENYTFSVPETDIGNRIVSTELNPSGLVFQLQNPMRYSNQSYYIEITGVKDLAGNPLAPQYCTARIALQEIRNLSRVKLYPNPIRDEFQQWLTFVNFPEGHRGRISIFDSAGSLVYTSSIGPFNVDSNNITWRWNLINNSGLKVSSGIYYYVIEMNGDSRRGQFAIIK